MQSISITLQDSTNNAASSVLNALGELASKASFSRIRVAVAYATQGGCRELISELGRTFKNWSKAEKHWIVGIDHGVTEPQALAHLLTCQNSVVRVPEGSKLLKRKCRPAFRFHPKTYILDTKQDNDNGPLGLFTGSANLTCSGLRSGTEHGAALLWMPPLVEQERVSLNSVKSALRWWDTTWSRSDVVTDGFIQSYEDVRPQTVITEDDNDLV